MVNTVCKRCKYIKVYGINYSFDPFLATSKYKGKSSGFELSSNMHMYYAFGNLIYSFSSTVFYVFLLFRDVSFSVFIPIAFETVHTWVSIKYLCS